MFPVRTHTDTDTHTHTSSVKHVEQVSTLMGKEPVPSHTAVWCCLEPRSQGDLGFAFSGSMWYKNPVRSRQGRDSSHPWGYFLSCILKFCSLFGGCWSGDVEHLGLLLLYLWSSFLLWLTRASALQPLSKKAFGNLVLTSCWWLLRIQGAPQGPGCWGWGLGTRL